MTSTSDNASKPTITWQDFQQVELRVGRVLSAQPLPQARQPALVLQVDFGAEIGIKKSSAQITAHYRPETLVGKLVVAVTNFPPKQIGNLMSECLVTGFHDENGAVRLCVPDGDIPLGTRLA
jgi:tRNA-binding protein